MIVAAKLCVSAFSRPEPRRLPFLQLSANQTACHLRIAIGGRSDYRHSMGARHILWLNAPYEIRVIFCLERFVRSDRSALHMGLSYHWIQLEHFVAVDHFQNPCC